jgi:N-acetylneuraminic acid mutarotase
LVGLDSDGTFAYAIGGYNSTGDLADARRYDPASNGWTSLPPLPIPAGGPSVVYAPNTRRLYVFGGERDPTTISTATQIYDPAIGQWANGAPMPAPRTAMTSGYWNGKIYLAAGTNTVYFAPQIQVWAYDPLLDTWDTNLLTLPAATMGAAGGIIDGLLLLAGGANNQAQPQSWLLYYDLTTQEQGFRADLPLPVYEAGSAVVNGQLWVFGGGQPFARRAGRPRWDDIAPQALDVSEIYDPFTNHWQSGPSLNVARALVGGTAVGNQVLAVGGLGSGGDTAALEVAHSIPSVRCPTITPTPTITGTPPTATPTVTPSPTQCGIWGTIDPWTYGIGSPPPVSGVGMTSDGASVVIAGGDVGGVHGSIQRVARYDPRQATWAALPSLVVSTSYASLIYAPNVHTFYNFGGLYLSNIAETSVQSYNPLTPNWVLSPQPMPDRRAYLGTVYANGLIYVVGGTVGNVFVPHDNLWAYDPVADTWDTTLPSIPAGTMGAVTGVIGGHLLVAGGAHAGQNFSDTLYDYDIAARTWATRTTLLQPVFEAQGAVISGRLWVIGGGTPFAGANQAVAPHALTTVQIYDPVRDRWSWGPPLPAPRSHGAGSQVGNTAFVFAGSGTADLLYTQFHPGVPCATHTPTALPSVTATRTATPTRSPTSCPIQFSDVGADNPFAAFIRCLTCRGVVSGYVTNPPCTTGVPCFRPTNFVTRGQAAKFAANAAHYQDIIPPTRQTFSDVPPASPFWVYVERVALHGVISGYSTSPPCTTGVPCFMPAAYVTRGQMAKFTSNAAGYTDPIPSTQQTFRDVLPGSTFWIYIERVAQHGVISGYSTSPPCTTGAPCFLASNAVTRGQATKFSANAFFPNCSTPALVK